MRDNRIIQQLVAENSATFRKKVAEHSVTTEIERINSAKEKLEKISQILRLSLSMSDKPICDVCGGEGQIHDADFSEGDSDQQMHLMQDTLRSCPKCSSTPNPQQLSEEQTIKAKIALAKTIPVIAVGDVDPLHMAAEIMLKVISDVTSSNARFLSVQSLIEDSPDLAKVMLSKLFDSYKANNGKKEIPKHRHNNESQGQEI